MPRADEFSISKHALRRLEQRGITREQIRRALFHPDRTESDTDDTSVTHAIKRFHVASGSMILRVVYNHTVSPWLVVTAFFDRKARQ